MLRGLYAEQLRTADGECLPVVHRYSREEMAKNWMWYIRSMSLCVAQAPSSIPEGEEIDAGSRDFGGERIDERVGRPLRDVYYYVRDRREDGHCVWLSPFWVDLPE